jgi:hypothetical protein
MKALMLAAAVLATPHPAGADEWDDRIWAALAAQIVHEGGKVERLGASGARVRKRYDDNRRGFSM